MTFPLCQAAEPYIYIYTMMGPRIGLLLCYASYILLILAIAGYSRKRRNEVTITYREYLTQILAAIASTEVLVYTQCGGLC